LPTLRHGVQGRLSFPFLLCRDLSARLTLQIYPIHTSAYIPQMPAIMVHCRGKLVLVNSIPYNFEIVLKDADF
jgi:hypothetical protein